MKFPSLIPLLCASLLTGCVGKLQTTPYRERTENVGGALRGLSYALPKLVYDTKLTRWLSECPNETGPDGKPTALKFSVEVEATPRYVAGEAYTVDYERLAGFLRTSNFDIKYYENGTLKSIGAGAEDHSAEVIKDTVKTALAIASSAAGAPALTTLAVDPAGMQIQNYLGSIKSGAADPARFKGVTCNTGARTLVHQARGLSGALKSSSERISELKTQIERVERRGTLKLARRADRELLLKYFDDLDRQSKVVEKTKKELAAVKEKLGISESFVWDSDWAQGSASQVLVRDLDSEALGKFRSLLEAGPVLPLTGESALQDAQRRAIFTSCYGSGSNPDKCARQQLALEMRVAVQSALPDCVRGKSVECVSSVGSSFALYRDARDGNPDHGIFVREPSEGRLLVCRLARHPCEPKTDEANLAAASFPQLGQLRFLPLKVRTFQSKDMTLSLTKDGRLEAFGYKSSKSTAQALASTAADVATQVDAALEKRETERRDDLKYQREQQTAEVQSEINHLTKELELRNAQDALALDPLKPVTDQTAALTADIALLTAQLAKLKAEAALSEYQAPSD